MASIRQRYAGMKIIVGRDKLDGIQVDLIVVVSNQHG